MQRTYSKYEKKIVRKSKKSSDVLKHNNEDFKNDFVRLIYFNIC